MLRKIRSRSKTPDASSLRVIVEHPVALLPDDVLRLLPHDVFHLIVMIIMMIMIKMTMMMFPTMHFSLMVEPRS